MLNRKLKNYDFHQMTQKDWNSFVKSEYDVNQRNEDGFSPLYFACWSENLKLVKLLIKAGAKVNEKNVNGDTPFHTSIPSDIAKLLIKSGTNIQIKNEFGQTPLYIQVKQNKEDVYETVKCLIEKGANIQETDDLRRTPIHWACKGGNIELVRLIIEKGADIGCIDINEETPLHWAKNEETIKLLVEKGADVNAVDKFGCTPIFKATNIKAIQALLENGADVDCLNHDDETPLEWILENLYSSTDLHQEIKDIFFSHRANLEKNKLSESIYSSTLLSKKPIRI